MQSKQKASFWSPGNIVFCVLCGLTLVLVGWMLGQQLSQWHERVFIFIVLLGAIFVSGIRTARCRQSALAKIDELTCDIASLQRRVWRGEAILAHTPNGVISIDSGGIITVCNAAVHSIFGIKETLVGSKIEDADIHPELARLAYDCSSSGAPQRSEIKLPGWPVRVFAVRAVPVLESESCGDAAILIIQDVSEMRRRQMHEREFVGNVSHELRTPITAVRTTAEALIAGAKNDPEVVDRFLNVIVSESERLSALIEDLLEITRRDYGIIKSENVMLRVTQVVERAVGMVRPQASLKSIELMVDVEEGLVAYGDETQILQLIGNLVDNAVKYTPERGIVDVVARGENEHLLIKVKDNGIGIPHGEIERIFERFYRVDKARSRRMGGTGLGLAIVKDIVDACGGKIYVETELGNGCTFSVELPMMRDNSDSTNESGEDE